MSYYPIFLELEGRTALVVGGGSVAQRKVETLLEHGASIRIVSNELTNKLKVLIETGTVLHAGDAFTEKHLDGVFLVFAATDDRQLNHEISESARKNGLLINAADQPADCDFIVPSIINRGDLSIAISTSGKSPALAKSIRKQLEPQFGKEYEIFLDLMGCLRHEVISLGLSQQENSRIFHEILHSDTLQALKEGNLGEVEAALIRILPKEVGVKDILNRFVKS
ncbi:MAG: bifunctional precorrin-2 dehydrogenase/sirohydrochlorin ferrochelatase [Deltaproteobacteria bacterium]|nr:bifunctional precorrin-2 dehydrogenase/sirohydrochlorin ferrochelatase [Deltaproteobacteria bacterium]